MTISPSDKPQIPGGRLGEAEVFKLRRLAQNNCTTLPVLAISATAHALAQWSCQDEILISVLHTGRLRSELQTLIGCMIEDWILRLSVLPDEPQTQLLKRARDAAAEAAPHMQVPGQVVIKQLTEKSADGPWFIPHFNYFPRNLTDNRYPDAQGAGCNDRPHRILMQEIDADVPRTPILEACTSPVLGFHFAEVEDHLAWYLIYAGDWFTPASMNRLSALVSTSLKQFASEAAQPVPVTAG